VKNNVKSQLVNKVNGQLGREDCVKNSGGKDNLPSDKYLRGNYSLYEKNFLSVIQKIINTFPFFIVVVDEDHNILLANDTVLNSLGKNIEDVRGCYCPQVIHGIDDPFPGCPLEEAIKKECYIEKDLFDPFYKKWVSSAIYPMSFLTPGGKKVFFHTAIDITERKKAEEIIYEQNQYIMNILESLTQPFYIINVNDYTIKMANSAANFGNLTKNSKCYRLTHNRNKPCSSAENPCTIKEILKTKKATIIEHCHYSKNGKVRHFEVHGYPIFDSEGNINQIIEYTIDITKRKQTERKLEIIRKNLKTKSKKLEEHNIALKVLLNHQDNEKKEIYRNILKNLKNLVYPYLEKLKGSSFTESQRTLFEILESNLSEIIKPFTSIITNEIINFSPTEVRVASLIKEGKTAKEIASIMYISESTVKAHFRNIRSKLKIKNKKINLKTFLLSLDKLAWYKKF
jgi:PAS domain S-box-containing protein